MAYNFKERSFTSIGKVDQRFNEFFNIGYESIEYKDEVYFVAFEKQDGARLKVGKLYQTSQRQEIIFDKRIDYLLPESSSDIR